MLKFNRNYRCVFEIGKKIDLTQYKREETFEVQYPITLSFGIQRSVESSVNTGSFRFYNLSPDKQAKLFIDFFQKDKYVKMSLYAGYGEMMPLIFSGEIQTCFTYRDGGSVDYITEIQANDLGYIFQYGFCSATVGQGTTASDLVKILTGEVPQLKVGFISPDIQPLKKDTTFVGQPIDLLARDYGSYQVFVDMGNLHILGERDVLPSEKYVLTANSGLLGTPRRSENTMEVRMIFEPGISVGQSVQLLSDSINWFNGTYKVLGVKHSGTISPTRNESVITIINISNGDGLLRVLEKSQGVQNDFKGKKQGWVKPVSAGITGKFWEYRKANGITKEHYHKGLDFGCPIGTPVKSASDGVIMTAGVQSGYGNVIYVNHGTIDNKNVTTRYAHLNSFNVAVGQRVKAGDIIGYSGNSGGVPPHLHFEVREGSNAVNPAMYIGS